MKKGNSFDIFPGDAPVVIINRTLELEMEIGPVKFSVPAQRHAYKGHPTDVPVIVPHLSQILTNPLYLGNDLKNSGKIELVGRILGHQGGALVSLTVEMNENDGHYHVCSTYLISQSELDKKRSRGILKIARSW